ncbi:PREDICTED: CASP-like protein 4D1 [Theobroma cacao]|uniref:CASP-like protein n=1 Tax=Theobroma cacao TaxID=3641 RepID=A0AB32W215_THECC|nr:PREDICTED: CASP-like protein 4D1 [Theobroma cacao]
MAAKAVVSSTTLALRIFAFLSLLGSLVTLVTDSFIFGEDHKITFKDITTYRYVFSATAIGVLFTLLQIPFAIYHVCWVKRMILPELLLNFDFYADKVISNLLAAGVGAGFAYSMELKTFLSGLLDSLIVLGVPEAENLKSEASKFLDKGNLATSLLLIGFVCVAVLSVLSSAIRRENRRGFIGGDSSN